METCHLASDVAESTAWNHPISGHFAIDLGDALSITKDLGVLLESAFCIKTFSGLLSSDSDRHIFILRAARLPASRSSILDQLEATWRCVRSGKMRFLAHFFLSGQERLAAALDYDDAVYCRPDINLLMPIFRDHTVKAFVVIAPTLGGIRATTVLLPSHVQHDRQLYIPALSTLCSAAYTGTERDRSAADILTAFFQPEVKLPTRETDFVF